jgi:hypothetical protein
MSKPTLADDCERLIRILEAGPPEGMSLVAIQDAMDAEVWADSYKSVWSLHTINNTLCALRDKVEFQKVRESRTKVTKYRLKKGS